MQQPPRSQNFLVQVLEGFNSDAAIEVITVVPISNPGAGECVSYSSVFFMQNQIKFIEKLSFFADRIDSNS